MVSDTWVVIQTLLIHTSSPMVGIGLADGGRMIARDEFPSDHDLAAQLSVRIRTFLHTARSTLRALDRIVVHAGPGGFTTLRIGVTTANTFAFALGVPIIGVTGPVDGLDELLRRAGTTANVAGTPVLPVYDRAPTLGPIQRTTKAAAAKRL